MVLDNINHSEITCKETLRKKVFEPILAALKVGRDEFPSWCDQCEIETNKLVEKYSRTRSAEKHSFQNTIFLVTDDQGNFVEDYAIEFYGDFDDKKDKWARVFNNNVSTKVHPYGNNSAYRSFKIDVTQLRKEFEKDVGALRISLTAEPDIRDDQHKVGYRTSGINDIGQVILSKKDALEFFQPNRTLFVNIELPRYHEDEVFRLENSS